MATMSDSSRNHNETQRDLDESACAARRKETEAVRERLSGSVIGEPARSSTARTSQEAAAATPVPFPGDLAPPNGNGDASALDVTSQQPPPSKKRRTNAFFQRCFDATFNPNDATAAQRILAPDSDEDDG